MARGRYTLVEYLLHQSEIEFKVNNKVAIRISDIALVSWGIFDRILTDKGSDHHHWMVGTFVRYRPTLLRLSSISPPYLIIISEK